ncbi:hypothetical protein JNW88_02535 [Micromonospora sp. ATA32]|nr:hypothetical protein [Micromonospora sp. ATA32]
MSSSDDIPNLTPNQINALVVLMVEARELTNSELKELAGFALTGVDNAKLVKLGLVETDRTHRPFSHQLTDEGWRVVRGLHTANPPRQGGSAARSLFTLLTNLHRSLDRLRVSHGDFFKQTPLPEPVDAVPVVVGGATSDPATTGAEVESLIRAAYRELANTPGAWVGLADLRDHLVGQERAAVDAALTALVRQAGVRIIPVANTKSLTPRDRAAAVRIGDEDNHALSIGPA